MSPYKESARTLDNDLRHQEAVALDDILLQTPADITTLRSRIDLALISRDMQTIEILLERATTASPNSAELAVLSANTFLTMKDFTKSIRECERALRIAPSSDIFAILARAQMPGPTYLYHLRSMHNSLKPKIYLEIGVDNGSSLRLARPNCDIFGVDPAPNIDPTLRSRVSLFQTTSDHFFNSYAPQAFGNRKISVGFIDGLHLFEQALRDFINVEQYCDKSSTVAVHDTLPVAEVLASRKRESILWCGDVWKLVPCLQKHRPDLRITTIPAFPSGLTIITGTDPENTMLSDSFEMIVDEYIEMPYSIFSPTLDHILRSVPNPLRYEVQR